MNGCRWREKSFSVATVEDRPSDICKCGKIIIGVRYSYNGDMLCQQCFSERKSISQRSGVGGFNTTRDKLYHFTHQFSLNEKPVEIRGKDHWRKEIKSRGLTDDFEQKPRRPENLKSHAEGYEPVGREFIRDEILKELQEKGLRHKLFRRK